MRSKHRGREEFLSDSLVLNASHSKKEIPLRGLPPTLFELRRTGLAGIYLDSFFAASHQKRDTAPAGSWQTVNSLPSQPSPEYVIA